MNKITHFALAGVAALAFSGAASAAITPNLVGNGDFQASKNKLDDWTATPLVFAGHDGKNEYATFAGIGSLSQKIDTVAGQDYELTFDLASASLLQAFKVSYGGKTLYSSVTGGLHLGEYDLDFTGVSNGTLKFSFLGLGAAALDNVSVVASSIPTSPVPEPASVPLLLAGLATLGLVATRRRKGN